MDTQERLYEFYRDSHLTIYKSIMLTPPDYKQDNTPFYQYRRDDSSGLDDYLTLRSIDWKEQYLIQDIRGVSPIPYTENGEVYTVLIMPKNMLYLAGMDIKFNKVREETKGQIKIEPLRHLLLTVPTERSHTQVYVRIVKAKRLYRLTLEHLLQLRQQGVLSQEQINHILNDLVNLMLYLWSQGVQGLRNGIFLDENNELTFIPFVYTRYVHYGVDPNPDDLTILSSFATQLLNLPRELIDNLTRKDWGNELFNQNNHREGLEEFKLPDVNLSEADKKSYHNFFERGTQNMALTMKYELAEMFSTLINLGLKLNLKRLSVVNPNQAANILQNELLKVYTKNLSVTRYLRPPIFHFRPNYTLSANRIVNEFPVDHYQSMRQDWINISEMTKRVALPGPLRLYNLRFSFMINRVKDISGFKSRRFTLEQEVAAKEARNEIFSKEYKQAGRPLPGTENYKVMQERALGRYYVESYVGKIVKAIRDFISYPQVPLYVLGTSHKKTVINGIEFSTYDLSHIFFDTPLFSELENMILSGFSRKDLKLIKDFLEGRKPITSLYHDLSESAYNQLSSYGSLLSTLEIPQMRQFWCQQFILGLSVVEQIRQRKTSVLYFLGEQGFEYLIQRMEII